MRVVLSQITPRPRTTARPRFRGVGAWAYKGAERPASVGMSPAAPPVRPGARPAAAGASRILAQPTVRCSGRIWGCIVGKWAARAVDGCHRGKTRFSGMAHKSAGDPEPRARYRSILSRLLSSDLGVDTQARSLFARRDPGPRATQTAFDGRHIGIKTSRFLIRLRIRLETLCVSCDHCNFRTASCPTL